MSNKAIVLDANILIRAVLGKRVRELIFENASRVKFFAPDVAYDDARKYLPALLEKRGVQSTAAMKVLDSLEAIVQPIDLDLYIDLQQPALKRIGVQRSSPLTMSCSSQLCSRLSNRPSLMCSSILVISRSCGMLSK